MVHEPQPGTRGAGSSSGFPGKTTLKLSKTEAVDLQQRFLDLGGTLLGHLLSHTATDGDIEFPWPHPHYEGYPSELRMIDNQARLFSESMHGAAFSTI